MSSKLLTSMVNASTSARYNPTNLKASIYIPFGQSGSGCYGSTLGKLHAGYTEPIQSKVFKLALSIPFANGSVFNIGDYGTADGGTSMVFLGQLITLLKQQHGSDAQFQIIYEDQGENDFNSLFRRLTGIIPDPPSYLIEMDNVYALACGTDFYKQCVPSHSMHFIMCMMSVHWLSKLPTVYRDSVYISHECLEKEKEALRKQAQFDWERFLLMRSREMKEGGLLFVCAPAEYVHQKTGRIRFSAETIVTLMTNIWKSFTLSGKITRQEFINTNISFCLRNMDQIREPFKTEKSQVVESGLRLLSSELIFNKNIFYYSWKQKKDEEGIDDREGFARAMVSAHRNWSNHSFIAGLSESRSLEDKETIVDDLYANVTTEIAKMDPEMFKDDLCTIYVLIKKV
ncbi:farnesoic acid carboxyl-O-methyltransferase-like [Haliotis rufescens]|uniref:farnesoic acid carboxyl-O-methyltransferase-like n=1 Tax=Haliotis rufescens TaxID=6454 RepID=UPI00201F6A86|nr:farnesoic acid carboxyl-O-methyltransferase-like [Haliotis rufescens]